MFMPIKRQAYVDDGDSGWWYYSQEAYIIKWIIVAVIFLAFFLFLFIGYTHAQRRMKKGLPPLRYHMWLVSRQQRERFFPPQQNSYAFYRPAQYGHGPQAHPMQPYGPPPPAYQEPDYVPAYSPPQGGTKINPDQTYTAVPNASNANVAGSSNYDAVTGTQPPQPLRATSPRR